MKTILKFKSIIFAMVIANSLNYATAQNQHKPVIAVLNIESNGVAQDAQAMGNIVRLEFEKVRLYSVMDIYDITDILKKNNIDIKNCYGKSSVLDAGKILGADKMVLGNIERIGEKIAITLKIVDVKSAEIEKSFTQEYLNLPQEIQRMTEITVKKLTGIEPDQNSVNMLIAFDQPIESPKTKMNLSGPRIGAFITTGDAGKFLRAPEQKGGFGMYKVTSQIGWQQEVQYLSSGNFSALVEFLMMAGGMESGRFIPSFSSLLGFRMEKHGLEFAIGPSFKFIRKADGYYTLDENGNPQWHLVNEWNPYNNADGSYQNNPYPITTRIDSRGSISISGGLVLAVGKTFKSGYLNIPVNFYMVPRKEGSTYGLSMGFNIYKK
jgi:hypothetical protein